MNPQMSLAEGKMLDKLRRHRQNTHRRFIKADVESEDMPEFESSTPNGDWALSIKMALLVRSTCLRFYCALSQPDSRKRRWLWNCGFLRASLKLS